MECDTKRATPQERTSSNTSKSSTSRQQNTHITGVVLYPWHSWHGRTVWIFTTVAKDGQHVYRCALESASTARPLEVPQWMFDPGVCCRMQLAASPSVDSKALLELKQLLASARAGNAIVLQAEHHSLSNPGGADATHAEPATTGNSTQFVSSSCQDSSMDTVASGDTATNDVPISVPVAATLSPLARRRSRGGAAR